MKKIFTFLLALAFAISGISQNTVSRKLNSGERTPQHFKSEMTQDKTSPDFSKKKLLNQKDKGSVLTFTGNKRHELLLKKNPNSYKKQSKVQNTNKSVNSVIWTNDFSVSTQWQIGNLAGNTQNWVISTTGPTGTYSGSMGPINSATAANGFAMYDSDAIGTSANQLGDQNAFIRTVSPFSCVGHPYVKLSFQQLYRKYHCQTFVSVKAGTGSWVEIEVNSNLAVNDMGDDFVEVDISSIAGDSANVYIAFRYYGEWDYAWMIDDIVVEDNVLNDAETNYVFTLGKIPQGISHQVTALVHNAGAADILNAGVNLNVSGSNIFTGSQTIDTLSSGEFEMVTFPAFSATNTGINNVSVSVVPDSNNTNNSFSYYQEVGNTFSYCDTAPNSGGLGYADGSGTMLCRYWAESAATVQQVNVFIPADADNMGQTVYAVVMDDLGNIVTQSANHVIASPDTGQWVSFALASPPSFVNEDFYVGLAQTANATTPYYPLGTQSEPYPRDNAFFIGALTGGTLTEANTYGRFMIEAVMGSGNNYDCGISTIVSPTNDSTCTLGANEPIVLRITNYGLQTLTSIPVSFWIDNGTPITETVTTSLASGASYDYTFTATADLSGLQYYNLYATTSLVNDEDTTNDMATRYLVHGNATVTVEILTDDYGNETYWGLYNNAGELLYVDGIYDNNTLYSIDLCVLNSDCYTFVIFDDYGDGILAPGYYNVYYENTLVGGNSNFTGDQDVVVNVGGGCPSNDLGVDYVYTLGKMPKSQGSPHTVSALIYNYGTDTQYNVDVSLNISGANTFTTTHTIDSIHPGQELYIDFAAFSPQSIGINDVSVSLPTDEDLTNNSFSYFQDVNYTTFSYSDTSAFTGGIGYNTGSGLLFNRFFMNGSGTVTKVGIGLSDDMNAVGDTIYGVVLNSDTIIVGQSAPHIIASNELGTTIYLDIDSSATFVNQTFFAGMAQLADPAGYFPLAVQDESFTRDNTFFGSALDGSGSVAYTSLGRFMIDAVLSHGPAWTYTNTGINHTVLFPPGAQISIDGVPAQSGDFIGAFYDAGGVMACAGYVEYTGVTTAVTVWGAQPNLDDGFQVGETFNWVIWDAATEVEFPAVATYNTLDFPNAGAFVVNGMSGITNLTATTSTTQSIALAQGWGIYSSYVDPFEASLDSVFSGIISTITIVKNGNGLVYWPQWGLNAIGDWNVAEGYQVNSAIAQSVDFTGTAIVPETYPISIPAGWSIMAYLRQSAADITVMMSPIVSAITIMKSGSGGVYWPVWGVNGIGNMIPGQGYQINLTSSQIFTFAANSMTSKSFSLVPEEPFKLNTGNNMSIMFPAKYLSQYLRRGDKILAVNAEQQICGEAVFTGNNLPLCVWGKDELNATSQGFADDEEIQFKYLQANNNLTGKICISEWAKGDGSYKKDGIAVVDGLSIEGQLSLGQNYPNPVISETNIEFYLPVAQVATLRIYNMIGVEMESFAGTFLEKGKHNFTFEVSQWPAGKYLYQLVAQDGILTKSFEVKK